MTSEPEGQQKTRYRHLQNLRNFSRRLSQRLMPFEERANRKGDPSRMVALCRSEWPRKNRGSAKTVNERAVAEFAAEKEAQTAKYTGNRSRYQKVSLLLEEGDKPHEGRSSRSAKRRRKMLNASSRGGGTALRYPSMRTQANQARRTKMSGLLRSTDTLL